MKDGNRLVKGLKITCIVFAVLLVFLVLFLLAKRSFALFTSDVGPINYNFRLATIDNGGGDEEDYYGCDTLVDGPTFRTKIKTALCNFLGYEEDCYLDSVTIQKISFGQGQIDPDSGVDVGINQNGHTYAQVGYYDDNSKPSIRINTYNECIDLNSNLSSMFSLTDCLYVNNIDFSSGYLSGLSPTNTSYMFTGVVTNAFDLRSFNFSNVSTSYNMFGNNNGGVCTSNGATIRVSDQSNKDFITGVINRDFNYDSDIFTIE